MTKKTTLDFDYKISSYLAYKHAKDFLQAAETISESNLSKPTVVNISFACELYFKALIIWHNQDDKVVTNHKLKDLFDMLPPDIQKQVKNSSKIAYWDTFMKETSNAFAEWRYYYEKDKCLFGHIRHLFDLATILDKICMEIIIL